MRMELDVGARIAHWRRWRGWTPRQLAEAVKRVQIARGVKRPGLTPAAVYQWEGTGETKTTPSQAHLSAVVEALDLTMAQFYGRLPKLKEAA